MTDTQRYNFEQGKLADWVKVFSRTSSVPLDRSQLFDSYEDALAYAQGDGSDYRGIGKTAWVGQPISVVENNVAKFYIISEKSTVVDGETVVERVLESVGGSSVVILENFTIQGGSVVEATADKVGSLVYITAGSAAYPKGLYIITGANKVAAFATPDNLKIVKKETANSGASATYELQLNGVKQGVAIDIPKDLVVSGGSIVTFTDSDKPFPSGVTTAGTYIKLTLANSGGDLYINVNSLVDAYTAGDDYIKVENYKISLNWDDVVAALIVDTNFTKFVSDTLASFKTTLLSELDATYASKGLVESTLLNNVDLVLDHDNIEISGTEEDADKFLTLSVVLPSQRLYAYTLKNLILYGPDKKDILYQSENDNKFKISYSAVKDYLSTSSEVTLTVSLSLTSNAPVIDDEEFLVNKFIKIYSHRTVYIGQCSEQNFDDKVFNGPGLRKFGYVPEPKLNHYKSDVQILGNLDMTYIEEDQDTLGGPSVPQYLMFALRLQGISDDAFNRIRVKSNGFTIPFVDTGALITNSQQSFPNYPELPSSAYRVFRSSVPMLNEEIIENLEVEFCKG